MEMTTEQRNYFIRRLDEIVADKLNAKAVELYGPSGRPEQPTWGQVFAAIKAGEIVLKEGTEGNTKPYLMPQDVEWPAMEAKREQLEAYRKQLAVERKAAMDAVMLNEAAATVLSKFEML